MKVWKSSQLVCLVVTIFGTPTLFAADAGPGGSDTAQPRLQQVAEINRQIAQVWSEYQITPSRDATELEWCRRLHLDVIGRIPTVKELQQFAGDKSSDKREKLVAKLLHDDAYTEEYARNWTTIWTNILIGRNGGTDDEDLTNRAGMQKYLRDTFARNKPYDTMVRELITATGATEPGHASFNGAVNFLVNKVNEEKASLATAAVSKTFLGMQVQCTQCHNHPFNEWKQRKYWEFNAFFRQTRALRRFVEGTNDISYAELVNEDFPGESNDPTTAEIYYELRNGRTEVAYPVFIDGTEIGRSGYLDEVDRRSKLGELVLTSEYLDKMLANRMWAHFMGYGFTKPIDDLGPHSPPSHPALLDYLGKEIRNNSYDVKELIKWLVLSKPYALSSITTKANASDDPQLGETPKFSHFYLRQMRAEELYESLITATHAEKNCRRICGAGEREDQVAEPIYDRVWNGRRRRDDYV